MRALDAALLRELAQAGVGSLISGLAPELAAQCPGAGVDTPLRLAHFLAQGVYETGYCTRLAENLHYSEFRIRTVFDGRPEIVARAARLAADPVMLANAAYAGVNGNGDEASGDGYKFRGRGWFMLTGRSNYETFGYALAPDDLMMAHEAVESAVKFWTARDISPLADDDDIGAVTRAVNGGTNGISERALIKHRALRLLTAPAALTS